MERAHYVQAAVASGFEQFVGACQARLDGYRHGITASLRFNPERISFVAPEPLLSASVSPEPVPEGVSIAIHLEIPAFRPQVPSRALLWCGMTSLVADALGPHGYPDDLARWDICDFPSVFTTPVLPTEVELNRVGWPPAARGRHVIRGLYSEAYLRQYSRGHQTTEPSPLDFGGARTIREAEADMAEHARRFGDQLRQVVFEETEVNQLYSSLREAMRGLRLSGIEAVEAGRSLARISAVLDRTATPSPSQRMFEEFEPGEVGIRARGDATEVVSETLLAETGGHDFEAREEVVNRVMPFDEWLKRSSEVLEQNGLVFPTTNQEDDDDPA